MASAEEQQQVSVRCATPPIPSGTKPLQHQVAGHVFGRPNGHSDNKIGNLRLKYRKRDKFIYLTSTQTNTFNSQLRF